MAASISSGQFVGVVVFTVGVLNAFFYKATGRKFFAKTQSERPFIAKVWAYGGERGVQFLFLGFGILLAIIGCVLIVALG
jgi:hypothetical protein